MVARKIKIGKECSNVQYKTMLIEEANPSSSSNKQEENIQVKQKLLQKHLDEAVCKTFLSLKTTESKSLQKQIGP